MDKHVEASLLMDFYGGLLTEKQAEVMRLYFDEDVSLGEIGSMTGVSRQAVHDIIHRSEQKLHSYEEKLGLLAQFQIIHADLQAIQQELYALDCQDKDKKAQILDRLSTLMKKWEA